MREFLYDALASEYGIVLRCDDPIKLRERLYPLRKAEAEFADLSFVLSPENPETELWIIKRVTHEKD
jgi:hypothetical protein